MAVDRALRGRQVRLVIAGIVGLSTGFAGAFIGTLMLFLKPIAHDFGWSRADISAGVVMSMLGLAIGSPIQGTLIDRLGARPVIAGSVAALVVLLLLLSNVPDNRLLFALTCLAIGVFGTASGPNGYLSLLPAWFDRRLGLALACAMIGVGLGAASFSPLMEMLIRTGGWRHAYRILAIFVVVGGVAAQILSRVGSPPRVAGAPAGASAATFGMTFREGLRDWRMRTLIISLMLGGASGLGITFHIAAMLDDRGFGAGQMATVAALSGVGLLVGRLIGGPLLDEIPTRYVGAGSYLIGAIAAAALTLDLTRSFPVVAAGGLMLGMALGTEGDLAAYAVRRFCGTRAFAGLYGCLFMAYSLGSVVGVILCGRAYDMFGDYFVAGIVCVIVFLVATVLMLRLDNYRLVDTSRPTPP